MLLTYVNCFSPVAEIHMRQIHEEGEKEVLCTYCGEGFHTTNRARQHEVKYHIEGNAIGKVELTAWDVSVCV